MLVRPTGIRLFPEGAPKTVMNLAECETFDNGVAYLNYRPVTG